MVPKVTLKKYEARRYTKNDRGAEKKRAVKRRDDKG